MREHVLLLTTAASIGFLHTLLGPDHYLPFIVMSKARRWSLFRTLAITFLCGVGHIVSSVVLGLVGIAFGIAVFKLEAIESFRGDLAGWFLIAFGLIYFMWGMRQAFHHRQHQHSLPTTRTLTPWILFTIFVFGPCEPLIPIVMYPAAQGSIVLVGLVVAIFGAVTILTMMGVVTVATLGLSRIPFGRVARFSHALAGLLVLACGGAITFLGL